MHSFARKIWVPCLFDAVFSNGLEPVAYPWGSNATIFKELYMPANMQTGPSNLLKGKRGIIFGALNEQSLAWATALKCHEEGAQVILTNAPIAMRLGEVQKLGELINAPVIAADVTKNEQLANLIDKSMAHFGGQIDFILHSVGMSLNIRKKHPYTELNHDFGFKTLDISAMSLHRLLQVAFNKNAISEWGSVVALTYIAAQRVFPHYNEMADAKSLLESIARNFGLHYGTKHKVRINTISQSPTPTMAGSAIDGFRRFFEYSDDMSPLGNAPATAFASYCVTLFSDYTRYVTMQNLYHDGGFGNTGITQKIIGKQKKGKGGLM